MISTTLLRSGLTEIGKLKIGGKKEINGKLLPTKADHFTVVTTFRENQLLKPDVAVMNAIGPAATTLKIALVSNELEDNWRTHLAFYEGTGTGVRLSCKGDGCTAKRLVGTEWTDRQCPCELLETTAANKCKPHGILSCVLLDAPSIGGLYKFRTTSWNTIKQISASLGLLWEKTSGKIYDVPLQLELKPQNAKMPNGKPTKIYVVHVTFRGTMEDLLKKVVELDSLREKAGIKLTNRLGKIANDEEDGTLDFDEATEFASAAMATSDTGAEGDAASTLESIVEPTVPETDKPATPPAPVEPSAPPAPPAPPTPPAPSVPPVSSEKPRSVEIVRAEILAAFEKIGYNKARRVIQMSKILPRHLPPERKNECFRPLEQFDDLAVLEKVLEDVLAGRLAK